MKLIYTLCTITITMLILTGCSRPSNINNLIYIPTKHNSIKNKISNKYTTIYIGDFISKDYSYSLTKTKDRNKKIKYSISTKSLNDMIKNLIKDKLSTKYSAKFILVKDKPKEFIQETMLYIGGKINNIILNDNYPNDNNYLLDISYIINNTPYITKDSARLEHSIEIENQRTIADKIFNFGLASLSKVATNEFIFVNSTLNTKRKLYINNNLYSIITYNTVLDYTANWLTNAIQHIDIKVYSKIGDIEQHITDNSSNNENLYVFSSPLKVQNTFDMYGTLPINNLTAFLPHIAHSTKYINKEKIKQYKISNEQEKVRESNNKCSSYINDNIEECNYYNISNTKYYDIIMLYGTNNGVFQNLFSNSIDKVLNSSKII